MLQQKIVQAMTDRLQVQVGRMHYGIYCVSDPENL